MAQANISQHPMVLHKLTILRDKSTEPRKFRELVKEISALLTYEATRDLPTIKKTVDTPMGKAEGGEMEDTIGLVPILRAGLGMVDGVWELIPDAQVWHIGLFRDEKTLQPVQYYNKLPLAPTVGVCLVLDPMLATGGSAAATVSILKEWGVKNIRYIGLLGAPEGIRYLAEQHPDVPVFLGAQDERLNEIGYIVPGLGDAGDRQFGTG
ncbi:MAG: uracil phosphoribosyltransferase [Anaerolineales bacterium]|jgi:uracil phosphoribosyltransferase|nr:uracil phosphoribosyltransferase [Anaerolineales bacterium]MBX3006289.1 uracil phosphoribosyltransferase [Anaerolineales bacterium]MCW5839037.1 uracil phosphoribosyltransferase [Anaerolineales bacterium]